MKIHIKAFGCSASKYQAERLAGQLAASGHCLTDLSEAEAVILNVCTVKGISSALRAVKSIPKGKRVMLAGCVSQDLAKALPGIEIFENVQLQLEKQAQPIRFNPVIGIVQICSGCLSSCSYCSVKLIKGQLVSKSQGEIVQEVTQALAQGCREIWLTGQDTGCWGFDFGSKLPRLLKALCAIEGDFFIRLGMANPRWVKGYLEELLACYKSPKIFKFLHIPLESGSDGILEAMARGYRAKDVVDIAKAFRSAFPLGSIATDVIVGFPGESWQDFFETVSCLKAICPDVCNVTRFVPRPGTAAAQLAQLPSNVKKERSRLLTAAARALAAQRSGLWLGWQGQAIVDELGSCTIARNFAYKPIVLFGKGNLGQQVDVEITDFRPNFLIGKVL